MKNKFLITIFLLISLLTIQSLAQETSQEDEKKPNYYELLEVQQDASEADIKKSFRKLARMYHPDKLRDVDEEQKKASEKKFAEIANAYEILSDPKTRQEYDYELKHGKPKMGNRGRGGGFSGFKGHADFDSFFKSFFDNDDDFFNTDDIFAGMGGFGGRKGKKGGAGGFGSGFGGGFGGSSFSSSSFSFGGGASTMQSMSTRTIFENGVQKTVTKRTTSNPDGTQTVEETISDGVETKTKNYMIGTDNKRIEIGDGKTQNNNQQNQQQQKGNRQYKRQNQHIFEDKTHEGGMESGFNLGGIFGSLFD